jgi:hypothetical protein
VSGWDGGGGRRLLWNCGRPENGLFSYLPGLSAHIHAIHLVKLIPKVNNPSASSPCIFGNSTCPMSRSHHRNRLPDRRTKMARQTCRASINAQTPTLPSFAPKPRPTSPSSPAIADMPQPCKPKHRCQEQAPPTPARHSDYKDPTPDSHY